MQNEVEQVKLSITPKYLIGEIVYLVTDNNQNEYIVTALRIEYKAIKYYISHSHNGEYLVDHFEISKVKTVK